MSKILTDVNYHGSGLLLTGSDSVSNAANPSENGTGVAGECQSQDPSDQLHVPADVGPSASYPSTDQQSSGSSAVSSDTSSRTSTPPLCTAAHSGTTTTVSAAPPCRHDVSEKSETTQTFLSAKTCDDTMSAAKRRRVGDESMSEGCRYDGQSEPRQESDIRNANDHHGM